MERKIRSKTDETSDSHHTGIPGLVAINRVLYLVGMDLETGAYRQARTGTTVP